MNDDELIPVTMNDEPVGSVDATTWRRGDDKPVIVKLRDGREVVAERRFLKTDPAGSLSLHPPHRRSNATSVTGAMATAGAETTGASSQQVVIPLVQEELDVAVRAVESGRVRIRKVVREEVETIDRPLMKERVNVERVAINRFVDGPVPVRYEGDMMIVPVLEEVLVIEKRLMLKEELRVSKYAEQVHEPQDVTVRIEEAHVERISGTDR